MQAAWEMLPHPVGKSRRRTKREIANRRGGSEIKFHATLKGKKPRNLSVRENEPICFASLIKVTEICYLR